MAEERKTDNNLIRPEETVLEVQTVEEVSEESEAQGISEQNEQQSENKSEKKPEESEAQGISEQNEQQSEKNSEKKPEKKPEEKTKKKSRKKRKGKKRRKVRFLKLLILLLLVGVVASLAVLMNTSSSDRRFIRSAVRGVQSGWSLERSEKELQETLDVKDAEFINKEYEAISEYKDVSFRNRKLGKIAKQYVEALEGCRAAMDKYAKGGSRTKFWSDFAPYYGQRLSAIYALYNGNYDYDIDEIGHREQRDKCLVQGWALEKTSDIEFVEKSDKGGVSSYQAEVNNDSGFDLSFMNIEVELLDKDGKLVETVSTYVGKWPNGKKKTLKLYSVSSKIVQCRVASVACDIESDTAASDSNDKAASGSSDTAASGSSDKAASDK